MEMILEYTLTKKDYEKALCSDFQKRSKASRFGRLPQYILGAYAGSLLLGGIMVMLFSDQPRFLLPTIILALAILIFALVSTNKMVQAKLALRRQIKSGEIASAYFGPHVLEVNDDRLLHRYGNIVGERLYGGIERI